MVAGNPPISKMRILSNASDKSVFERYKEERILIGTRCCPIVYLLMRLCITIKLDDHCNIHGVFVMK